MSSGEIDPKAIARATADLILPEFKSITARLDTLEFVIGTDGRADAIAPLVASIARSVGAAPQEIKAAEPTSSPEQNRQPLDSVDLIKYGDYGVFAFENDQLYKLLGSEQTQRNVDEFYAAPAGANPSSDHRGEFSGNPTTRAVFKTLSDASDKLTVLDVGGHWGLFSIDAIYMLKSRVNPWNIVCFEPGPTADLIAATIELNKLESHLSLRTEGVLDRTGPSLFYRADWATNANALRRNAHHEYASLVRSIDIREIMADFKDSSGFVIKLDVEGLEPRIVGAIKPMFQDRPMGMILEFAYGPPREEQIEFLKVLGETHEVFDTRTANFVPSGSFDSFVDSLFDMPAHYTDIACVPKNVGLFDRFRENLANNA